MARYNDHTGNGKIREININQLTTKCTKINRKIWNISKLDNIVDRRMATSHGTDDGQKQKYSPTTRLFHYKLDLQFFGKKAKLLETKNSELEKKLVELNQELTNLKTGLDQEKTDLIKQRDLLWTKLVEEEENVKLAAHHGQQLLEKNLGLQNKISELEIFAEQLKNRDNTGEIESLNKEILRLEEERENWEKREGEYKKKKVEVDLKNKEIESTNRNLEEIISQAEKENKNLENQIANLGGKITNLKEEKKSDSQLINELETKIEGLIDDRAKLKNDIKNERGKLESQVEIWEKKLNEQINSAGKNFVNWHKEHVKPLEELLEEKERKMIEYENEKAEESNREIELERESLENQPFFAGTNQNSTLGEELKGSVLNELDKLKEELAEKEETITKLKSNYNSSLADKNEEIAFLQGEQDDLKEQLAQKEEQIRNNAKNLVTQEENNQLKTENSLLRTQIDEWQRNYQELQTKHDDLNRGYLGQNQQMEDLNSQWRRDYSELEEKWKAAESNEREKERQLAESNLLRTQLETEKNNEIEWLNGSLTEKEDNLKKQVEQLQQLEGKLNAQKDYEKIKSDLEQFRRKNTELENQISTLQEKNDDLDTQLLTFDETQEELEKLQRQLEELKSISSTQVIKIEELENNYDNLRNEYENLQKATGEKITKLERLLSEAKSEYEEEKSRANGLESEKNKLTTKSENQQTKLNELEEKLRSVETETQELRSNYENSERQKSSLERELENKDFTIENLTSKNSELKTNLETAQNSLDQKIDENETLSRSLKTEAESKKAAEKSLAETLQSKGQLEANIAELTTKQSELEFLLEEEKIDWERKKQEAESWRTQFLTSEKEKSELQKKNKKLSGESISEIAELNKKINKLKNERDSRPTAKELTKLENSYRDLLAEEKQKNKEQSKSINKLEIELKNREKELLGQLEKSNREITILKRKLNNADNSLTHQQGIIDKLNKILTERQTQLEKVRSSLQLELDAKQKEKERIAEKLKLIRAKQDELQIKFDQSERAKTWLEDELQKRNRELIREKEITNETKNNLANIIRDSGKLYEKINELEQKNEKFANDILEAERLRKQTEQESGDREKQLSSEISRISTELASMNKKIGELTSERDAAQTVLDNRAEITPEQLATLNQEIVFAQQKINQLEKERDVTNDEFVRLQKDLSTANENNRINKNKIELQKVQITTRGNQINDLQSKASQSQKEINSLRKAETQLQKNNGSLVSELKREKNAWNKEKTELERKFKELQSELRMVKRDRDSRPNINENGYNELLEQLEEFNRQVSILTDEKENLSQKLDNIPANWQVQISQSQAAQEQAEQNLANLQIELTQIQEEANTLNKQIRNLQIGLATEQGVHRETQSKLGILTTQLNQKNKNIQNLQVELNKRKEQAGKLNKRMTNVLQETKDWKIAYKQAQREVKMRPTLEKYNNLKSQLKTTNKTTNLTKKHLRVKSLNNLPALPQNTDGKSKSLKQLIGDFVEMQNQAQAEKLRADTYETDILTEFNITDVSDWKIVLTKLKNRPFHADYDSVWQERNKYKMLIDDHTCSAVNCQEPCCLGDYERLQNKLTAREKEILREINNFLKLDLANEELTLKKVITRIEELIRNPLTDSQKLWKKLTRAKKTIKLLQKQLVEKDTNYTSIQQAEYQKVLQLVKNDALHNCEKLGINIPPLVKENIKKATTLEMVIRERNNLIQNKLAKNGEELKMIAQQKGKLIQSQNQERWIWGSFLLISYLIIVGLLVKLNKRKRVK